MELYRCDVSPEGTLGIVARSISAAPSGLGACFVLPIHGLAPVANTCRPSGTQTENTLRLLMHTGWPPKEGPPEDQKKTKTMPSPAMKRRPLLPATKWRHALVFHRTLVFG